MIMLYACLFAMLLFAISLIAIPFLKNHRSFVSVLTVGLLMLIFSFGIYQFSGNKPGLYQWLSEGKSHYKLLETFNDLGGVEGAIQKIKARLEQNPRDAQGWLILGKLYMSQNKTNEAKFAFARARELEPSND